MKLPKIPHCAIFQIFSLMVYAYLWVRLIYSSASPYVFLSSISIIITRPYWLPGVAGCPCPDPWLNRGPFSQSSSVILWLLHTRLQYLQRCTVHCGLKTLAVCPLQQQFCLPAMLLPRFPLFPLVLARFLGSPLEIFLSGRFLFRNTNLGCLLS